MRTDLEMWRDTLGARMLLKKSGLTTSLRWEIPMFSFAVKKIPDRGVGSI